jgi:hypothetical protein
MTEKYAFSLRKWVFEFNRIILTNELQNIETFFVHFSNIITTLSKYSNNIDIIVSLDENILLFFV